jgi:hypothetical protein
MDHTVGILSFWNFKEYSPGKNPAAIVEYPLYTDSHITGELLEGCEPYAFLNTIATGGQPGNIRESVVLRIFWYVTEGGKYEVKTDNSKYHGGWITDEIAALASLKLGIRLKAGSRTRMFGGYSQDSLGTPYAQDASIPQLITRNKRLVLPSG